MAKVTLSLSSNKAAANAYNTNERLRLSWNGSDTCAAVGTVVQDLANPLASRLLSWALTGRPASSRFSLIFVQRI